MTREEYKELRIKTQIMVKEIVNCSPSFKRIFFAQLINLAFILIPMIILFPILSRIETQPDFAVVIEMILIFILLFGSQVALAVITNGRTIGNLILGYSFVYQNTGKPISKSDYFDLIIHGEINDLKYNDFYEFYDQIADPYCRTKAMRKCGIVYGLPNKLAPIIEKYKDFTPVFASYEEYLELDKLRILNGTKKRDWIFSPFLRLKVR